MESMFDKVWRLLADDEVRIMGLYGQAGVGKTTLLKQINNAFLKTTTSSSSTTHGFDVVILVVVSKVINIKDIHKEIGEKLGLSSPNEEKICNALSKKKFLLLLDDIWERVDLQSIGIPPRRCSSTQRWHLDGNPISHRSVGPSGTHREVFLIPPSLENNRSKVVFTTRSEAVCGLMKANEMLKVECLPWNQALSLFQEKVGNETLNSFPRARELAEVVARECSGLPLALVTIGRAMSSKKSLQEWNHAITTLQKSASELPGTGDEVLPLLKLSYDNLGDDMIKSCFLYCALFPEDHLINKAKLVDYWIVEGFLNEFDHIDKARNQGYDVIGVLKGAGLLESDGQREETQVKMHAMIRNLALWIAHECGSSKWDKTCIIETSDLTAERSWYNAERIYLRPSPNHRYKVAVPPPSPLKSPNLITLIYHYDRTFPLGFYVPQHFFEFTPLLRVLDLSHVPMGTFPMCITELLELRYLSISNTYMEELPKELGKLVKLNYLDLSRMWKLKKIPSGVIGNLLLELRVLNLYFCAGAEYWDIEEGYNLEHLNDLQIVIYTQQNLNKLLSNQNLQRCTRNLSLFNSQYVEPQSTSSSPIITLEKLQLLSNLETLSLYSLPESDVQLMNNSIEQQHLGSSCFQNLSRIEIKSCNGLKDLTWVGYVPNLKTLFVYDCKELEEIVIVVDDDFGGSTGGGGGGGGDEISTRVMNNVQDVFKRLETLILSFLPKLKSICRNALAFPCLESILVLKCPQLKKLPLDSGSNVNNTLQKIDGTLKWWSELQWEEEEDHNNNNEELLKSKFLPYFIEFSVDDDE